MFPKETNVLSFLIRVWIVEKIFVRWAVNASKFSAGSSMFIAITHVILDHFLVDTIANATLVTTLITAIKKLKE